jgi:hypothetical protein
MLRPYVFAVCEKVVVDANGVPSLIGLFNRMEAQIVSRPSEPVPANAVSPQEWWIFTSWAQEPEDVGKRFTQMVDVIYPDGTLFQHFDAHFMPEEGKSHHQVRLRILGFPIGQEGTYLVKETLSQDNNVLLELPSIKISVILAPTA